MVVVDEGEEDDEGDEEEGVEDEEEDEEEEEEEEEVVVEEGEEEDLAEGDEGETPVVYEMDEEDEEPEDGDDEEGEPGVRVGHEHCKPRANGRNIVGCYMLRPLAHQLHVDACCCVFLGVVAQSLKPVKPMSQRLPTLLLFPFLVRRSVAQQCWICSYSSSIVGATHTHSTLSPKSYRLYPSHNALQIPTFFGVVGICTGLNEQNIVILSYQAN